MPSTMYVHSAAINTTLIQTSAHIAYSPLPLDRPPVNLSQRETTSYGPLISRQSDGRNETRGWSLSDATLLSSLDLSREEKFAIGPGLWKEDPVPPDFLQPPDYRRRERGCETLTVWTQHHSLHTSVAARVHFEPWRTWVLADCHTSQATHVNSPTD
ncbi:hypothetical protein BDW42DRAFT_161996 [Aspergillus taichungensis]|uniref:Uncharacterized protein n=1 Tax=Aspergillus taichungensis TaxID=482145 RepID=A0A2J5I471_9EURO|nr:hypothetical protein BDW42DRAFT_161996 [Aspergillus taichungensis]